MTLRLPVSKLPNTGTTIFTVMSRLAEQHGAVNLSQGFPDFDPPRRLVELVEQALAAGRNQYAPMAGVIALREAIAAGVKRRFGIDVDVDAEITITSGATEALFCTILALAREGDEVIVFDPAYDSYEPAITLAGARPVHLPLVAPDFGIDFDRLRDAVSERTRLVVINTPHNPTGALLKQTELEMIAEVLAPFDCYIISDEVYEHIVFEDSGHRGILQHPALRHRGIAISSFGKTFHATGWKVGYAIAPAPLTAELRRVHQFCTFATATPLQYAIADFLRENPEHHLELPRFYRSKRDRFLTAMADTPFRFTPARGTYFQLADYSAISDSNDVEFSKWLTTGHGVATIPVSVFYESPPDARLIRFCFAKEAATIDEARRRLQALAATIA